MGKTYKVATMEGPKEVTGTRVRLTERNPYDVQTKEVCSDLAFFAHKDENDLWAVSEMTTGYKIHCAFLRRDVLFETSATLSVKKHADHVRQFIAGLPKINPTPPK